MLCDRQGHLVVVALAIDEAEREASMTARAPTTFLLSPLQPSLLKLSKIKNFLIENFSVTNKFQPDFEKFNSIKGISNRKLTSFRGTLAVQRATRSWRHGGAEELATGGVEVGATSPDARFAHVDGGDTE